MSEAPAQQDMSTAADGDGTAAVEAVSVDVVGEGTHEASLAATANVDDGAAVVPRSVSFKEAPAEKDVDINVSLAAPTGGPPPKKPKAKLTLGEAREEGDNGATLSGGGGSSSSSPDPQPLGAPRMESMSSAVGRTPSGLSSPTNGGKKRQDIFGDKLTIRQRMAPMEAVGVCDSKNAYDVKGSPGGPMFFSEDSPCWERFCCGAQRSFELKLHMGTTKNDPVVASYKKKFDASGFCPLPMPCLRPELTVHDTSGGTLGRVEDPCNAHSMWRIKQRVYDKKDRIVYETEHRNTHLWCYLPCWPYDVTLPIRIHRVENSGIGKKDSAVGSSAAASVSMSMTAASASMKRVSLGLFRGKSSMWTEKGELAKQNFEHKHNPVTDGLVHKERISCGRGCREGMPNIFQVKFPERCDANRKSLILGSAILINFRYFENGAEGGLPDSSR